ncbi:hypothetical protein DFH09DRAFT_500202 [Mycena vulgaris]|nr:hypothetical protein DFH09DRAFT_500202 [Mycena vulgaris]
MVPSSNSLAVERRRRTERGKKIVPHEWRMCTPWPRACSCRTYRPNRVRVQVPAGAGAGAGRSAHTPLHPLAPARLCVCGILAARRDLGARRGRARPSVTPYTYASAWRGPTDPRLPAAAPHNTRIVRWGKSRRRHGCSSSTRRRTRTAPSPYRPRACCPRRGTAHSRPRPAPRVAVHSRSRLRLRPPGYSPSTSPSTCASALPGSSRAWT